MNILTSKRLRRKDASQYLMEQWGISRTPATLAKLACIGGSPKFQHASKVPLYPVSELDSWAEAMLTPLKRSTSDNGGSYAK